MVQIITMPKSCSHYLIQFNKEKKGVNIQAAFFLMKFPPSISEPTLTLARKAKPRSIPILSEVHCLQNIGNICAHDRTGHSELLGIEHWGQLVCKH